MRQRSEPAQGPAAAAHHGGGAVEEGPPWPGTGLCVLGCGAQEQGPGLYVPPVCQDTEPMQDLCTVSLNGTFAAQEHATEFDRGFHIPVRGVGSKEWKTGVDTALVHQRLEPAQGPAAAAHHGGEAVEEGPTSRKTGPCVLSRNTQEQEAGLGVAPVGHYTEPIKNLRAILSDAILAV